MEITQKVISWEGERENGGKGTGNKKHEQYIQNRQRDIKNSMGNGEAKLICMTGEHKLSGENAGGGVQG